ncbi:ornithine--oxo-acid transaminase [Roseicella frigidaeris]|uniref:ornithine aminotransferase n=1 Tax=Roseicella frigidaeris TaxID=2230885 RepID=A0A327MG83_9PROT|nr:ornithine--oxo-acid transaminase [Roseicella frigidaeris]RAI61073.1 ornithine--oxo-acid transaminase [Roseicella frigidaeris]
MPDTLPLLLATPGFSGGCDHAAIEDRLGARNYKPLDVVLARGEGVWVWDVEGRRYLDCLAGYSAVNQGHCHPRIRAAMVAQAGRLTLTSRAFRNDQFAPYLETLCGLTGFGKALPVNSGAEAVESAVKLARRHAYDVKGVPEGEAEIIVAARNFHGRTTTVVSFSTDPTARTGFGPFTPGFRIVPFGDAAALEAAITPRTAAVLLEPIQGEAGVVIPPEGYLRAVRAACDRHRVLLILDEVQTGLGRTGRMLAAEHEGVRPDLLLLGKALSGGFYPVSAVLGEAAVMDVIGPGEHGSTFGGNPLACAVAREALRVLVEEDMVGNAARMGERLLAGLRGIGGCLREVRGRGLMLAAGIDPAAGTARAYCEALREAGLLCKDTHDNTIRISPPLVITAAEVDWALEGFARVFQGPPPGRR